MLRKLFKRGNYSKAETIPGNTVFGASEGKTFLDKNLNSSLKMDHKIDFELYFVLVLVVISKKLQIVNFQN